MVTPSFKCQKCRDDFERTEIVTMPCRHYYCLECLSDYIKQHLALRIKCPSSTCVNFIPDKVIRDLMDDQWIDNYDQLSITNCGNMYRCVLEQCGHFIFYTNENIQYDCSNCSLFNCIQCKASHKNMTCVEYRKKGLTTKGADLCRAEMERARKSFAEKCALSRRNSITAASRVTVNTNNEIFKCNICEKMIAKGAGVQLKECFHLFCRNCLTNHINLSNEFPIPCPGEHCKLKIGDAEARQLISINGDTKNIQMYESKMMRQALPSVKGGVQCMSINCTNLVIVNENMKSWLCQLCQGTNCLQCRSVHVGKCPDLILSKDEQKIEQQIKDKKLMRCLHCKTIIKKISGCNWIKCSNCQTELCWINQTYRWGPGGRGDTSGGCKCGVNGKKCHPLCSNCIPHSNQ